MNRYICQGTRCHTYDTQSRIRGTKGNKVLRTRYAYGSGDSWNDNQWCRYFCDDRCLHDWLRDNIINIMRFVGIKNKPQETPIQITEKTLQDWAGNDYIQKTIVPLSRLEEYNNARE